MASIIKVDQIQTAASRSEAKANGLDRYFTGKPCKHGHVDLRDTKSGNCVECCRMRSRNAWTDNHDEMIERATKHRKTRTKSCAEYSKEWRSKNPAKSSQHWIARRHAKEQAKPSWVTDDDLFVINEVYTSAKLKTKSTGVQHHVDHIVPLRGRNVSGLHIWWNMQVVPADVNLSKSNKLEAVRG